MPTATNQVAIHTWQLAERIVRSAKLCIMLPATLQEFRQAATEQQQQQQAIASKLHQMQQASYSEQQSMVVALEALVELGGVVALEQPNNPMQQLDCLLLEVEQAIGSPPMQPSHNIKSALAFSDKSLAHLAPVAIDKQMQSHTTEPMVAVVKPAKLDKILNKAKRQLKADL